MQAARESLSRLKDIARIAWRADRRAVVGLYTLTIFQGAQSVLVAWLIKLLFDLLGEALGSGGGAELMGQVTPLLLAQGLILVAGRGASALADFLESELSRKISLDVQRQLFGKLNSFVGLEHFESSRFHDSLEIGLQGAQNSAAGIVREMSSLARGMVSLLGFLVVLLALGPMVALLVVLASIPDLVAQFRFSRRHVELTERQSLSRRKTFFYRNLLSGWEAAKEVRLYQLGEHLLQKLIGVFRGMHGEQRRLEKREMGWKIWASSIANLVYILAFVLVVQRTLEGLYSIGDVTLYTAAVSNVQGSLAEFSYLLSSIRRNILQFRKYEEIMQLPRGLSLASDPSPVSALEEGISIRELAFRYSAEQDWVLKDLNLEIPAGSSLALVGVNGAGKTTLVKLLSRLYDPEAGAICWDGVDLRDLAPDEVRERMGVLFQDFLRFDLSVWENIGFGRLAEMADREAIRAAAREAGIEAAIEKLPKGYDTVVSRWLVEEDAGASFSGGEWQKLALARLLFRKADFVILDEPTAALDAQAEHEIYEQILETIKGKTALIISHRFSTVLAADRIAVLQGGQISEEGSHNDLMALDGEYARLYKLQVRKYQQSEPW